MHLHLLLRVLNALPKSDFVTRPSFSLKYVGVFVSLLFVVYSLSRVQLFWESGGCLWGSLWELNHRGDRRTQDTRGRGHTYSSSALEAMEDGQGDCCPSPCCVPLQRETSASDEEGAWVWDMPCRIPGGEVVVWGRKCQGEQRCRGLVAPLCLGAQALAASVSARLFITPLISL